MFRSQFAPNMNQTQVFTPVVTLPADGEWKIKSFLTWTGLFFGASGLANSMRLYFIERNTDFLALALFSALFVSFITICLLRLYKERDKSMVWLNLTIVLCLAFVGIALAHIEDNKPTQYPSSLSL